MKDQYFVEQNKLIDTKKEHFSESKRYRLEVTKYKTRDGCWNYSQCCVSKDNTLLFTVNRNYGSFPFSFIENHPNGNDYLICGEDYQGVTLINLTKETRQDYLPEEAKKGMGFCMVSWNPSPDKTKILVEGCFWGGPYDSIIYDFTNPESIPWTTIKVAEDYYNGGFVKWDSNGIEMIKEESCRKSDGVLWKDLSKDDLDKIVSGNYEDEGTFVSNVLLDENFNLVRVLSTRVEE